MMDENQAPQIHVNTNNTMGNRVSAEFLRFLSTFELSMDDPNFDAYTGNLENVEGPVRYYTHVAEEMVRQEKYAMFVDYFHLKSFQWEDESFLDTLITEYIRYEPYLRSAISTFMTEQGHQYQKNRLYQIGIFNLDLIDKIRSLKTG
jgi:hypothetical protein